MNPEPKPPIIPNPVPDDSGAMGPVGRGRWGSGAAGGGPTPPGVSSPHERGTLHSSQRVMPREGLGSLTLPRTPALSQRSGSSWMKGAQAFPRISPVSGERQTVYADPAGPSPKSGAKSLSTPLPAPPCSPAPYTHLLPGKAPAPIPFLYSESCDRDEAASHGWQVAAHRRAGMGRQRRDGCVSLAAEAPHPAPPGCIFVPPAHTTLSP